METDHETQRKKERAKKEALYLISTIVLISTTYIIALSLHNVDNAWNMQYYSTILEMKFQDSNWFIKQIPPQDLYSLGMTILVSAFPLAIFAAFFLGYSWRDKHGK